NNKSARAQVLHISQMWGRVPSISAHFLKGFNRWRLMARLVPKSRDLPCDWSLGCQVSQSGSVYCGADHCVAAHAGVDHHVIQPAVRPVMSEVLSDVGCPALVRCRQLPLRVAGVLGEVLFEPLHLSPLRGVDEDVKRTRSLGQNAGCAPANDHALALFGQLVHIAAHQPDHALAVEDFRLGRKPLPGAVPEGLAYAVIPRVQLFVALLGQVRGDAGLLRDLVDQAAVNQPPSQVLGQPVSILRPPAAVFPFDRDHPNHGFLTAPLEPMLALAEGQFPAPPRQRTMMEETRLFHVCPPRNGTLRRSATLRRNVMLPLRKFRSLKIRTVARPKIWIEEMLSPKPPGNAGRRSPARTQKWFPRNGADE